MLFFFISKSNLDCIISVSIYSFLLSYDTWSSFNNGHSSLPAIGIENAGHANFLSNNTFHFYFIIPSAPNFDKLSINGDGCYNFI